MDNYVLSLIDQIHELLHRIDGYLDAKADLKPDLRFVENDDPKILLFPSKEKTDVGETSDDEQGFVEFTEKEINTMPKQLRQLIIVNRKRCRMRCKKSGDGYSYEIRFRAQGYNVSASGKTKALAKENMLKKLKNAKPQKKEDSSAIPTTFHSFATYYFENFRKEKVSTLTFQKDFARYKKHLQPYFQEKPLEKILPSECKNLYERLRSEGKGKTADEIYSILSIIFKGAIAHGVLKKNPLDVVLHIKHYGESGTALTKEEELKLLTGLTEPTFVIATALALYCGLRPNELSSAKIDEDFIVAINSKRKHQNVEYKKIPICKKLRPYIKDGIPELPTPQLLRRRIANLLPNHKLYDLRTTFYSRCKELGVSEHALKEFAGHSLGAIGNSYTDLSDEYLLSEGKKLDNW